MSIEREDQPTNTNPQAYVQPQQAQAYKAPQQTRGFSMGSIGGIARQQHNTSLENVAKEMQKVLDANKSLIPGAQLVKIDKTIPQFADLAFSAILVVSQQDDAVISHTLMFEHTGGDIPAKTLDAPNIGRYEYQRTADEAWDETYAKVVDSVIKGGFPTKPHLSAEGQLVRRDQDIEKQETIEQWLRIAAIAIETVVAEVTNAATINLTHLQPQYRLTMAVKSNQPPLVAQDGTYNRADFSIGVVQTENNQNNNTDSINVGQSNVHVAQVAGYVDVVPTTDLQPVNQWIAPQAGAIPTGKFIPNVVITALDNLQFSTVSGQLFALGSTMLAMRDPATLFSQFSVSGLDTHIQARRDPASLNVLANLENNPTGYGGLPADIAGGRASDQQLAQYLQAMLKQNVLFSMVVSHFGSDSWINAPFVEAAKGDPKVNKVILDRANELTNGAFANTNMQVMVHDVQEVVLGTYVDAKGMKRDIRDLDLIAVCNHFANDPEPINEYLRAMYGTDLPWQYRIEHLQRIATVVLGASCVRIGRGRLVKFNAEFVQRLCEGMLNTNRAPARTNVIGGSFQSTRYAPAWATTAGVGFSNAAPIAGMGGTRNYGNSAYSSQRTW